MKFNDVLTLTIVVFCLGVLISSVGVNSVFKADAAPPAALQQGITTTN